MFDVFFNGRCYWLYGFNRLGWSKPNRCFAMDGRRVRTEFPSLFCFSCIAPDSRFTIGVSAVVVVSSSQVVKWLRMLMRELFSPLLASLSGYSHILISSVFSVLLSMKYFSVFYW